MNNVMVAVGAFLLVVSGLGFLLLWWTPFGNSIALSGLLALVLLITGLQTRYAGSVLLFFAFVAGCGMVSLLISDPFFLLLPMFGMFLGVWRKGRHVNVGIRIALLTFFVLTAILLALLSPVILLLGFLFLFASFYVPQALLLVGIACAAILLSIGRPSNAKARAALLIFCAGAVACLALSPWDTIPAIFLLFSFAVLPVLLVAIGYWAGAHSFARSPEEDIERAENEKRRRPRFPDFHF